MVPIYSLPHLVNSQVKQCKTQGLHLGEKRPGYDMIKIIFKHYLLFLLFMKPEEEENARDLDVTGGKRVRVKKGESCPKYSTR